MDPSSLLIWVRMAFGLVIGLLFICVIYTIYRTGKDVANSRDDSVVQMNKLRSAHRSARSQDRSASYASRNLTPDRYSSGCV